MQRNKSKNGSFHRLHSLLLSTNFQGGAMSAGCTADQTVRRKARRGQWMAA